LNSLQRVTSAHSDKRAARHAGRAAARVRKPLILLDLPAAWHAACSNAVTNEATMNERRSSGR